jgi:hypothetical protein
MRGELFAMEDENARSRSPRPRQSDILAGELARHGLSRDGSDDSVTQSPLFRSILTELRGLRTSLRDAKLELRASRVEVEYYKQQCAEVQATLTQSFDALQNHGKLKLRPSMTARLLSAAHADLTAMLEAPVFDADVAAVAVQTADVAIGGAAPASPRQHRLFGGRSSQVGTMASVGNSMRSPRQGGGSPHQGGMSPRAGAVSPQATPMAARPSSVSPVSSLPR